jgi:glycosyltransferase involved in cell wall biosynthesis
MKILMTTDTLGGVWTYAVQLAEALQPHGVAVALATMGRPLTAEQRETVDALPNVDAFESRYRLEWMEDPWEDIREAHRWLLKLASQIGPDVVHLNEYAHGALSWPAPVLMMGHSCVLSWHRAVRGHEADGALSRYRDTVARGLRAADQVIAPTETMLESLQHHYGPLPQGRVIFNGRSLDGAAGTRGKEPFVLCAGRLWDEAKNVATLADAARQIPWPVHVAGENVCPDGGRADLEGVHPLGRLDAPQMLDRFARASIYALPARYEPCGLTPLEAGLSRCALILGDLPSLRELWDGAAIFVPPDDAAELGRAIERLIENPELRHDYAERAHQRAQTFSAERMAEQYLAAYRSLAEHADPEAEALETEQNP